MYFALKEFAMHAVVITEPGGPDVLSWEEVPDPSLTEDEVIIDVDASAVNRADLMQRQGFYPPPPGAPEYPGLECSGTISEVGKNVTAWRRGDQVCALLAGGGYAERVAVPAGQVLPIPDKVPPHVAGGLPEVACTVYSNVFMTAGLRPGETLLVHGGGSGIGTMAIQLAKAFGAVVACTAGSEAKLRRCRQLGADITINYNAEDFTEKVKADVILDIIGAKYLAMNIKALSPGGRLVIIGMQGGSRAEVDLGVLMQRRASVYATTLRARPVNEKEKVVSGVREHVWPLLGDGRIVPVIDCELPMTEAAQAHRLMGASQHTGKILLRTPGRRTAPAHVED
jgi:putative PIG3 family NAD(P)H quinone oxidoreductase